MPGSPGSLFRALGALLSALLAGSVVRALDPAEAPGNYSVRHWDTEDGLPHNSVKQLFQSHDGYLWIGTSYGLARFDGITFTVFNKNNTPEMRSSVISSMAETADGNLWIGTSSGLLRYRQGRFYRYDQANGMRGDTINALCSAPDGSLWIGSREGIVRWLDGRFLRDINTTGFDLLGMKNITIGPDGSVWIAHGTGVLRYRNGKLDAFGSAEGLPSQGIQIVSSDPGGELLTVTQTGLYRFQDERFVPAIENKLISGQRVSRTLVDGAGNLWIGGAGGLDRYREGKAIGYADRAGRKLGVVDCLLEDREGCLWVGSSDGLYRLTDRRASSLGQADGITGSLINAVMEARDGSLWISSWNGGVTRVHAGTATHLGVGAPLTHDTVTAIYEAPDGALWLGNRGSSIDRLKDDKVTTYVFPSGVATSRAVTTMLMEEDGTLLVGISNRGLLQLKEGKLDVVPGTESLNTNRTTVWKIHRTANGRLLLATSAGVYERRADRTYVPVTFSSLAGPVPTRDVLEVNGTLWLATDGYGLVRWQGDDARAYRESQGMLDDSLFNVLDDGLGSLWVASARGIARVRKSEFAALDHGTSVLVHLMPLGRNDGLQSASAPGTGSPSACRLADGRLLFATDQGVAVIDPQRLQVNAQPPSVVLERMFANDLPVPLDGKRSLGADTSRLEFRFTALSLMAPQRLRFRYQLVGSDANWVDAGAERRATYTHLAPGRYTFRVLACNNDGVWNETGSSLDFTIVPHFYQTAWFRATILLGMVGLIGLIMWFRDREMNRRQHKLARMNAELDQRVEQRTEALRRSQEQTALQSARFKLIFDSVPVGISLVSVRPDGTLEKLINEAHLTICGLTQAQADQPGIFARITHPDDGPAQEALNTQLESGVISHFSLEKRYLRPDGKTAWVVFTRLRLAHPDGNLEYLTTIIDITARKQAEHDLAEANRHLLDVSRAAGMAEVATGVLHNVGNVLNSLNISAHQIAGGLKGFKTESLAKLSALLQEHSTDLAAFLTEDPKGRRVPALVASLAAHLQAERDRLLGETASLQENVDHIRAIVTMQQTYATSASMAEALDAARLMEDALRIKTGKLALDAVRIERKFQPVGPVLAEKSKVLQILINLLSNARQACLESGGSTNVITLSIQPAGDFVRLSVQDTGVGIAPENLTRIFAHGFTTKATGHGFGLHSAAIAAKEMHSSLSVSSPGKGSGATFTLELPLAKPPSRTTPADTIDLVIASPGKRSAGLEAPNVPRDLNLRDVLPSGRSAM